MYERILSPTDGSNVATRGLQEAISLARVLKAELVVLHAFDDFPISNGRREGGRSILTAVARIADQEGVPCKAVLRELDTGHAADAIVNEAMAGSCGLIVMGTHGRRGLQRVVLGGDREKVLRRSPVPVLFVRPPD